VIAVASPDFLFPEGNKTIPKEVINVSQSLRREPKAKKVAPLSKEAQRKLDEYRKMFINKISGL